MEVDDRQQLDVRVGSIPLGIFVKGGVGWLHVMDDPTTEQRETWTVYGIVPGNSSLDVYGSHYLGAAHLGMLVWHYFYQTS